MPDCFFEQVDDAIGLDTGRRLRNEEVTTAAKLVTVEILIRTLDIDAVERTDRVLADDRRRSGFHSRDKPAAGELGFCAAVVQCGNGSRHRIYSAASAVLATSSRSTVARSVRRLTGISAICGTGRRVT